MSVSDRVIVAPFREALLVALKRAPLVVRLRHQREVATALDYARRHHLNVRSLLVETTTPLCAIDVQDRWADTAIALFVPAAGRYREFQSLLPLLRQLRTRVYLPPTSFENVLAVRILASNGVRAAVVLRPPIASWDALSDLMIYALAAAPHAPIEPFEYLATHYRPGTRVDYANVYFDDPTDYLHVDDAGRVALTGDDLRSGRFIADDVEDVDDVVVPVRMASGACARCPGWSVCTGRFADEAAKTDHCRGFFTELLDTIAATRRRLA